MLPLATALVVHLRSQFNHVFALLVSMLHFKSINFCKNMPKLKLFWQKKLQTRRAVGQLCPQTPKWPPLQISGYAPGKTNSLCMKICFGITHGDWLHLN